MPISESHASHIGRVAVTFSMSGPYADADAITSRLGIAATATHRQGEPKQNAAGKVVGVHSGGYWALSSRSQVQSKDINDHFSFVLNRLLPHAAFLIEAARDGQSLIDVLWESSYLYAGTGPLLAAASVRTAATLGASIGFDIYQMKERSV